MLWLVLHIETVHVGDCIPLLMESLSLPQEFVEHAWRRASLLYRMLGLIFELSNLNVFLCAEVSGFRFLYCR